MLSEEALNEFKKIYFEEYGEGVPDDVALDVGVNLLNVMNYIYRPIKKEWVQERSEQVKKHKADH